MILGVSFDSPEENAAFAKKFGFNFPIISDTSRDLGMKYGACTDPSAPHAARVGVIIGPDGKVKEWHPKVAAQTFPAEALQRI